MESQSIDGRDRGHSEGSGAPVLARVLGICRPPLRIHRILLSTVQESGGGRKFPESPLLPIYASKQFEGDAGGIPWPRDEDSQGCVGGSG